MNATKLMDYRDQAVTWEFSQDVGIDAQIKALNGRLERSRPIEKQHEGEIRRRILELKLSKHGIVETLPSAPLGQRNEHGQPILVPFALDSETALFSLKMKFIGWGSGFLDQPAEHEFVIEQPVSLPRIIAQQYQDMEAHLRKRIQVGRFLRLALKNEVIMSTRYSGLIPDEAYKKIQSVSDLFGHHIYLIAEVETWEYTIAKPRPIQQVDPLVVGCAFDTLYLITSFDPTTPEQIFLDSAKTGS